MVQNSIFTEKHPVSNFKNKIATESNAPNYFDRGWINYTGSKVENVKTTRTGDKFIFKEKLTKSPDKQTKYKLGVYDTSTKKLKMSEMYGSKKERDDVYDRVSTGSNNIDW